LVSVSDDEFLSAAALGMMRGVEVEDEGEGDDGCGKRSFR
jgi:hypothetical protein